MARMRPPRRPRGFTLIELMVVLAIVATLLSIALPRYFGSVDLAREATLRQDLAVMRDAIDKHHADTGRYPQGLEELVTRHYLRRIPVDPFTESAETWVIVPPRERDGGAVYSVASGASAVARDGTPVSGW
ncbi:MAG TPA: prepilin-type N-terminal cleavage/methylation domain-containing protein [Albitalea sp.]